MFTGPLDEDIGKKPTIAYIQSMKLSNNPLGGTIPKSLGKLIELEVLEMSGNNISGSIPKKVLNLEKLQVLDVSNNQLSGRIPPHNTSFLASAFSGNPGLCGAPLPPYKCRVCLLMLVAMGLSHIGPLKAIIWCSWLMIHAGFAVTCSFILNFILNPDPVLEKIVWTVKLSIDIGECLKPSARVEV
ncbi:LRR receptor-like serine/threonine-protein kinase GSO1 [Chenopodium quinoa]|uniref:LRR receptor-like serine/threonine-protein kinase GSO1 n=1 Tax=Chenopodium quinoa TaxID=63459 RepID=UPI000B77024F|nr:LRR receptor-like serine/threonine-protein kinase GSO1 [Chenopodium quinoa]